MQRNLKKLLQTFTICVLVVFTSVFSVFASDITLYPTDISYEVQNGFNVISKTYALSPNDDPSKIPKESFTRYNEEYTFSEIVKKESLIDDKMEHTETVTINTKTNDLNTILAELNDTIQYEKDGYVGTLKLDINSVKSEVSGYSNNSYTAKRTREYPNFSTQDTSQVPKTITDGGLTYNLQNVTFKASNTDSIDSTQIATSYTAVATYTTNVSNKSVNGYKTTANYVGTINKTVTDKVLYTATFIGGPVIELESDTVDIENNFVDEQQANKFNFSAFTSILKVLFLFSLIGALCFVAYYLLFYKNITVFNQNGLEYIKVGKLHLNMKSPKLVVNLNNLKISKISSGNFVIELTGSTIKLLSSKEVFVIFKDCESSHLVKADVEGNKYQFEANFEETDFDNYSEELSYSAKELL